MPGEEDSIYQPDDGGEGFESGYQEPAAAPPVEQQPMPQAQPAPSPGDLFLVPAVTATDLALRSGAGMTLLGAGIALGLGALLAGPLGGAAGVSLFGAGRNALRASRYWASPNTDERVEAGKSATMAVFGFGITGVLLYHRFRRDD